MNHAKSQSSPLPNIPCHQIVTRLTPKERSRFEICKRTIRDGLQTVFDTGAALIEVRDFKYYREDFDTFEDFCGQTYRISRGQAYRLIDAAETKESLPAAAAKLITNEAQARAIAAVPEEKRVAVLQKLKSAGEPVTAEAIKEIASKGKMSPIGDTNGSIESGFSAKSLDKIKPAKVVVFDDVGTPIPEEALPYWNRRQEVQDVLTQISRIKTFFEKAKSSNDPMYGTVSNGLLPHLSQAYNYFLEAKPYAVCTTCMGSPSAQPKGCSFCGNRGLISKWNWDTHSRKEVKEMRLRANARRGK